ncbi:MAG: hypothetical protein RL514_3923 [Verrucomicrobiota bacterium]
MKPMKPLLLLASLCVLCGSTPAAPFPVPTLDLATETNRQVLVDRELGQYLGHPTTVLLEDGKTILTVYPKGHGKGGIVYKRSADAGLTWSDRLPTPASWATSKEVPTLHRVVDAAGKKRLIMWSGLYPARLAVSEDDGKTWGELKQVGDWGGIVVMGFTEPLKTGPGHYLAMFHDDGRYFTPKAAQTKPIEFKLFKTFSRDGGLTWSAPETVQQDTKVHLCEPGFIRSPDGKEIAVLLRENSRTKNSHIIFSRDEGQTWTAPREMPDSLNGDRHTGKYLPDGRLFVSFRSLAPRGKTTPFPGDWVAWVGRYDDLATGKPGQYHVRLMDNTKGSDCAYPGVEVLPDATIVTTTYGHWTTNEAPYIVSVRLKLAELDAKAKAAPAFKSSAATESDPRLHADGAGWRLDKATRTDPKRPRVLLMGDSILNGYLAGTVKALDGQAYVDAWVNPFAQSSYRLHEMLAEVLAQGPYDIVHVNMGLHGWQKGRISDGQFEPLTRKLVETIRAKAPGATFIWASSTPVTTKGKPGELDAEINPIIVEHNRLAAKVMAEAKVPVNDLYAIVANRLDLARGDQFHWQPAGTALLKDAVIARLMRELKARAGNPATK